MYFEHFANRAQQSATRSHTRKMASSEELLEAIRDQGERGIALISELTSSWVATSAVMTPFSILSPLTLNSALDRTRLSSDVDPICLPVVRLS